MKLCKSKKETVEALLFAFLFSVFQVWEWYLSLTEVNDYDGAIAVIACVILTILVAEGYLQIRGWIQKQRTIVVEEKKRSSLWYFGIVSGIQFLCWIPVFLAYYPGLFAYDVHRQIPQIVSGEYSTHHPLAHTLLLKVFYEYVGEKLLGSHTAGMACYSIFQMLCFAMMLAYAHTYLREKVESKVFRIAMIVASSVLPFCSIMACSITKDTLFAGFFVVFFVGLCRLWEDCSFFDRKRNIVLMLVAAVGTILFRNNGKYAVFIAVVAVAIAFLRKKNSWKSVLVLAMGLVLGMVGLSGLKAACNATDGSKNEMLSIPFQQIAYVYHNETENLTEEEIALVWEILPEVQDYNAHLADGVKKTAEGVEHMDDLKQLYIELGLKYPWDYIKAFVIQNTGYFRVLDTSFAEIYGASLEDRSGYLLTNTKEGLDVYHTTKFAALEGLYEYLYSANAYQKIFVLQVLLSPAFYFWVMTGLFWMALWEGRKGMGVLFAFLGIYMLTLLAGPCVLIRYALPYIVCVPVLFAEMMKQKSI